MSTVLLVTGIDDKEKSLNLDELATDLEEEGFIVEKIKINGETKLLKIDLDKVVNNSVMSRRKRSPCLKCKLNSLKYGQSGYGGNNYNYPPGGTGYGGKDKRNIQF